MTSREHMMNPSSVSMIGMQRSPSYTPRRGTLLNRHCASLYSNTSKTHRLTALNARIVMYTRRPMLTRSWNAFPTGIAGWRLTSRSSTTHLSTPFFTPHNYRFAAHISHAFNSASNASQNLQDTVIAIHKPDVGRA